MRLASALALGLALAALAGCAETPKKDYYKDDPAWAAEKTAVGIFCQTDADSVFKAIQQLCNQRGIKLTRDKGAEIAWTNTIHHPVLGDFSMVVTFTEMIGGGACLQVDWKPTGKSNTLDEAAARAYVDGLNQDLFKILRVSEGAQ
jgi:hypothetical protein